jgi:hypothetical protein
MDNGDPDKQSVHLSAELYRLGREIAVFLGRDGVDAALALEEAGLLLLRLDEFCGLRDALTARLADGKVAGHGFTAYLRRMTGNVDDWSTSHNKVRQLPDHSRSDGMPVQMPVEKIA